MRYASAEDLLATKVAGGRSQDADDIVALGDTLGLLGEPASRSEALLRRMCPDTSNLSLLLGVTDPDLNRELDALTAAVARCPLPSKLSATSRSR